jgi:hypothetical protein
MNVTRCVVYGVVGPCKTESSQKPVPLHPLLAETLIGALFHKLKFRTVDLLMRRISFNEFLKSKQDPLVPDAPVKVCLKNSFVDFLTNCVGFGDDAAERR